MLGPAQWQPPLGSKCGMSAAPPTRARVVVSGSMQGVRGQGCRWRLDTHGFMGILERQAGIHSQHCVSDQSSRSRYVLVTTEPHLHSSEKVVHG